MTIGFKGTELLLNVTDTGKKDTDKGTLLLLHGWGTSTAVYKSLIDPASAYLRVVTYDIPGFGGSAEPAFAFSTDDYADLAFCVMEKLGVQSFAVAGHSHGGRTILNMLTRDKRSERITKAIIIDGAGIVHKKSFKQRMSIRLYKLGKKFYSSKLMVKLFPDALENFKKSHGSADYRAVASVMRESLVKIVNDDYSSKLSGIRVPVLLIWGDADKDTPIEDAFLMEKHIPDCGIVTVKGGSHYSFLDNPNLVTGAMRAFLS